MDLGIKGRRALVTASSGGMGYNVARALAEEGADLLLFSRSIEKLREVSAEIERTYGVNVVAQQGDMTNLDDVEALTSRLAGLDGPDIVVLLTGRPPTPLPPTLEETEPSRWQEAYEVQLASVVRVVNGVVPLMVDRGWGRIIAITSAHAKQPMVGHALSTVFRAGVTAYMKGLSNEVGAHGITVNCIAPALIDTSHRRGLLRTPTRRRRTA